MTKKIKKTVLVIILAVSFSISVFSQDDYVPYSRDEFPRWARDLRRFEIVFFGTIPFSFLYTSAGYSLYRYGSSNWDPAYAPALLGNKTPPILTTAEKFDIIYTAAGVSFAAAFVDFIIGRMTND